MTSHFGSGSAAENSLNVCFAYAAGSAFSSFFGASLTDRLAKLPPKYSSEAGFCRHCAKKAAAECCRKLRFITYCKKVILNYNSRWKILD
ncbi:MAG: hypothetical protein LIO87_00405 [Eubacterium sp.]|nr:hypothetical protein [Eubacterium sp.]